LLVSLCAGQIPCALFAAYPEVLFSAETVEAEGFSAHGVSVSLDAQGRFRVAADAAEVKAGSRHIDGALLEGRLSDLTLAGDRERLAGDVRSGPFAATFAITRDAAGLDVSVNAKGQSLVALKPLPLLPEQVSWLNGGTADLAVKVSSPVASPLAVTFELAVRDLTFDSPDGSFAGVGLAVTANGELSPADGVAARVDGEIRSGELLIYDFYRNFSDAGLKFGLRPVWRNDGLETASIRVSDGSALNVEARVAQDASDEAPWSFEISHLALTFPGAYHRYLESYAAASALDGLEITGQVTWDGEWSGGQFRSGDLVLQDLSVVDTLRNRFAVTGLDGRMRPGDHAYDSRFAWRGLLLGRINFGAGEIALESEPGVVALRQPLELDVLGGTLDLEEFSLRLPGAQERQEDPDIRLRADLRDLDMEQLTGALGWPEFRGRISGSIPSVRLRQGVLEVDGTIFVNVFDGLVSLRDLRVERMFGVLPSLAANVDVSNLDLGQLTSTFSFGNISGRLDGYVHDLRMLDWQPVAFDAWLGTPADQTGKQDISRRAVTHLTTLGGGNATAALASPLMRMFSNYSYRRLGMGCLLADNICEVRGLSGDDGGVLIMEGAGVPKITIRAFNRRVDWPQMVANLEAVSADGEIRVGD
jgi:hypothetical protein